MGVKTVWNGERTVRFTYVASSGDVTEREVIAQRIFRDGSTFRLAGHCLVRDDYREFRVDRIQGNVTDTETGEVGPLSHLCEYDTTPKKKPQPVVAPAGAPNSEKIRLKKPRKKPPYGLPVVPSTQNVHVEDVTDYKDFFGSVFEPSEVREMSVEDFLEALDGAIELELEWYTDFADKILAGEKLPEGVTGQDIVEMDLEDDPEYFVVTLGSAALESPLCIESGMPQVDDLVRAFNASGPEGMGEKDRVEGERKKAGNRGKATCCGCRPRSAPLSN